MTALELLCRLLADQSGDASVFEIRVSGGVVFYEYTAGPGTGACRTVIERDAPASDLIDRFRRDAPWLAVAAGGIIQSKTIAPASDETNPQDPVSRQKDPWQPVHIESLTLMDYSIPPNMCKVEIGGAWIEPASQMNPLFENGLYGGTYPYPPTRIRIDIGTSATNVVSLFKQLHSNTSPVGWDVENRLPGRGRLQCRVQFNSYGIPFDLDVVVDGIDPCISAQSCGPLVELLVIGHRGTDPSCIVRRENCAAPTT